MDRTNKSTTYWRGVGIYIVGRTTAMKAASPMSSCQSTINIQNTTISLRMNSRRERKIHPPSLRCDNATTSCANKCIHQHNNQPSNEFEEKHNSQSSSLRRDAMRQRAVPTNVSSNTTISLPMNPRREHNNCLLFV